MSSKCLRFKNVMMSSSYLKLLCLATVLLGVVGVGDLSAANVSQFGGEAIVEAGQGLKALIFGPIMYLAGVVMGGYGLIQSFVSSSWKPLALYGVIGGLAAVVPKLVEAFFGASAMLLP